jgi:hypothetical protein
MTLLLGFDPGGKKSFGWCVAENALVLPLQIRATGVVDNARDAILKAFACIKYGEQVFAAAIDAPMFWVPCGDRKVDRIVRNQVCGLKCPGGTVQAVNSLRGACLVQGMLTGILLREKFPALPITESHPKATLWLLRLADQKRNPASILHALSRLVVSASVGKTDHERDAAVAVLSAWAMTNQAHGWKDLYLEEQKEQKPYSPIESPLAYWMPEVDGAEPSREDMHGGRREQKAVLRYSMKQAAKVAEENPY